MAKRKTKVEKRGTIPIPVRFPPDTKDAIDAWAEERGITFAMALQTLVRIGLERTNITSQETTRAFGGKDNETLGRLTARIFAGVEHENQRRWLDDPETFDQSMCAIKTIFNEFRPAKAKGAFPPPIHLNAWIPVVEKIKENLDAPSDTWWPLADADLAKTGTWLPVLPTNNLAKQLAKWPRRKIETNRLHPKISQTYHAMVRETDELVETFLKRWRKKALEAQKKLDSDPRDIDDFNEHEIGNLMYADENKKKSSQKREPKTDVSELIYAYLVESKVAVDSVFTGNVVTRSRPSPGTENFIKPKCVQSRREPRLSAGTHQPDRRRE